MTSTDLLIDENALTPDVQPESMQSTSAKPDYSNDNWCNVLHMENKPREPQSSDLEYSLGTLWRNSDPTKEGELWYLKRFDQTGKKTTVAYWVKIV